MGYGVTRHQNKLDVTNKLHHQMEAMDVFLFHHTITSQEALIY